MNHFTAPLFRVIGVARILIRFGLMFVSAKSESERAAKAREALEGMGGAWIKLGQALALRFDLLPAAYCLELFKLLNKSMPFAYSDVREIIKEELRGYPEEVFMEFDAEPFAAASIGQVHRATLASGRRVAVKVQRPRIGQTLRVDINFMYFLSRMIGWMPLFGGTSTRETIREFERWTMRELNYLMEARNAHYLSKNAQEDDKEHNAKIYWEYTTARVLTSELIEGVPLVDIIYAIRSEDHEYLKAKGFSKDDLERIARNIAWNAFNQVYQHGYFHADLHPANLFVLPRHAIAYVDFGIAGRLSEDVRQSVGYFACHLYLGHVEEALRECLNWVIPSKNTDVETFRQELKDVIEEYIFSMDGPQVGDRARARTEFIRRVLHCVRTNRMVISAPFVLHFKALITATRVVYELSPNFDLQHSINRFFRNMIRQDLIDAIDPREIGKTVFDYGFRLRRTLQSMEEQLQVARHRQPSTVLVRAIMGFAAGAALLSLSASMIVLDSYSSLLLGVSGVLMLGILFYACKAQCR
jgi:predicted unusual protein kinase regulating ubiquinone biosynthesis (AarF/ABC1/UbiB family)